jgi:hypothetical protein
MKKEKIDLDREVKNLGVALIVLGVFHFILSQFLDFTWGLILITIGIVALFYRSRKMILTFGISLIVVGILNIMSFLSYSDEVSGFWIIFGIIQIGWGINEIKKFRRIKENPKYEVKEKIKKDFIWYGLRVGFWIMVGFWLLNGILLWFILEDISQGYSIFLFFWVILVIFTWILSILHLVRYKQKVLPIISLVLSSFLLITAFF